MFSLTLRKVRDDGKMSKEILLVEDDDSLNRAVSLKLSKEGYIVYSAASIKEARRLYYEHSVPLIICDIGLPDGSGLDFCSEIRKSSNVMFLFLTAMDAETDIINGYEAGADKRTGYLIQFNNLYPWCILVQMFHRKIKMYRNAFK